MLIYCFVLVLSFLYSYYKQIRINHFFCLICSANMIKCHSASELYSPEYIIFTYHYCGDLIISFFRRQMQFLSVPIRYLFNMRIRLLQIINIVDVIIIISIKCIAIIFPIFRIVRRNQVVDASNG